MMIHKLILKNKLLSLSLILKLKDMENSKKIRRIIILIFQFIILEIASFFIQKSLTINTDKILIKELIENAIIYGTILGILTSFILWIRWKYLDLYEKTIILKSWIEKSYVIHKYYDIMLIKAQGQNPNHPNWIYDEDLNCFDENEKKHLNHYLAELEKLKIYKRGTNKVKGQNI